MNLQTDFCKPGAASRQGRCSKAGTGLQQAAFRGHQAAASYLRLAPSVPGKAMPARAMEVHFLPAPAKRPAQGPPAKGGRWCRDRFHPLLGRQRGRKPETTNRPPAQSASGKAQKPSMRAPSPAQGFAPGIWSGMAEMEFLGKPSMILML